MSGDTIASSAMPPSRVMPQMLLSVSGQRL